MPAEAYQLKSKSRSGKSTKPYDRPLPAKVGLTGGQGSKTLAQVNRGAPSSLGQSSRKGKKAWRRNIDITAEEAGLEQEREEERVTGGKVRNQVDDELFTVDTVGDLAVAKSQRVKKPLRSLAVLSERSAIPSLPSRFGASSSTTSKKPAGKLSAKEKTRLKAAAKQALAEADGRGLARGALSAVEGALEDMWDGAPPLLPAVKGGFGEEGIIRHAPLPPRTLRRAKEIREAQMAGGRHLVLPEAGTSYNPTEEAHNSLLQAAVAEEMERLRAEEEEAARVAVLGGVIEGRRKQVEEDTEEYAEGMIVGPGEPGDSGEDEEEVEKPVIKASKRKTTAQRNRALRAKEAERQLAEEARRKKLARSVSEAKKWKKEEEKRIAEMQEKERRRKFLKREKERMGLEGGEKVGKFRVRKGRVDVALGEDLAESLRQLKPEGNRFRDQFVGLQKKGYVEPREPVQPKKRVRKIKEYEKHPWKRFQ